MEPVQPFQSSAKSLMSDADIMFDNLEYEYNDKTPMALMNDSDSEDSETNVREQREHFRPRSSQGGGERTEDMAGEASAGGSGAEAKNMEHRTMLTGVTTETTASDSEAPPVKTLGRNSEDEEGSSHMNSSHSYQESSSESQSTMNRVVVVIDEVSDEALGAMNRESNDETSEKHSSVDGSSVVHVGDVESELESLTEEKEGDDIEQVNTTDAQDFVDAVLAAQDSTLTKESPSPVLPDHDREHDATIEDPSRTPHMHEEVATNEGTVLTEKASADSLSSNDAEGGEHEDDPTESQEVMIIVSSDEVDVDELPRNEDTKGVESISGGWKLHALSADPETSSSLLAPDLACTDVDLAVDSFVAELEKEPDKVEAASPDRRMMVSQYLSSPTPTSVREFWKVRPTSPTTKEKDPALQQAVATTPVRARREAFLTASSTPKAQERDLANDPAFATPVSERREALLSVIFSPKEQSSERDDALLAASMTPVHARQASLVTSSSRRVLRNNSKDEAMKAATRTPVHARQASFVINSTQPILRSNSSDEAMKAATKTPVHARQASFVMNSTQQILRSNSSDEAIKAASKTPVHARQASFVINSNQPKLRSVSKDEAMKAAATTPVDVRRATLTAEISELSRKPEAESDEALLAAAFNPVDARRAALTAEIGELSRKPSIEDYDEARLAASFNPVMDRRALLVRETSSLNIFQKRAAHDAALQAASNRPVDSRRAALAEEQAARNQRSIRDLGLWALAANIKTRRAALARDMLQSSTLSLRLQAELDALKEKSLVSSRKRRRNRRARNDRLFFQLNQRRGGMNDKDFLRLNDFLPHQRMLLELKASSEIYEGPQDSFEVMAEEEETVIVPLRVWLTCPEERVFEIVNVEMKGDMTVEDVVEEACALALDPVLSEQHYVSLCNKHHELVQPLASVRSLLQLSGAKKHQTLMAVPFGSTAALVRAIRRVLEQTKQVKRLLRKEDPKHKKSSRRS